MTTKRASSFIVGVAASGLMVCATTSASASLAGVPVDLSFTWTESIFVPPADAGTTYYGNYVVGSGAEWGDAFDVYNRDDPSNPYVVGEVLVQIDIGADYIEWSMVADIYDPTLDWGVLYLTPGDFVGYNFDWSGPMVDSAVATTFGDFTPVGHIGDWDLWEDSYPAVEAWVDSYANSPIAADRVAIDPDGTGLHWNMQGISFGYDPIGGQQTGGVRLDLTFVPAPGVLALLGFAGLRSGRRRECSDPHSRGTGKTI